MGNLLANLNFGAGPVAAAINRSIAPGAAPVFRDSALCDLEGIVARTVLTARAAGRDYMSQSRAAATAVLAVRPDLSLGQALEAVTRLREVSP